MDTNFLIGDYCLQKNGSVMGNTKFPGIIQCNVVNEQILISDLKAESLIVRFNSDFTISFIKNDCGFSNVGINISNNGISIKLCSANGSDVAEYKKIG